MSISVNIKKRLGNFTLDVEFESAAETLALLGASGCGKSMTLKCIAGIERPDEGKIILNGKTLFDSERKIDLSPQKRKSSLLFQNYALFPNMNVRQNIAAGIKYEKDKKKKEKIIDEYIERFGLKELEKHLPSQLSGGQQQRTALARALIAQPDILLLDEPFSALDSHLRFALEQEVKEVIRDFARPVILVSHDRDEVFRLSDKIAVMNKGCIECFGPKEEIFAHPATRASATLTGYKNISPIKAIDSHRVYAKDWGIELESEQDAAGFRYAALKMENVAVVPPAVRACEGDDFRAAAENSFCKTAASQTTNFKNMHSTTGGCCIHEFTVTGILENPACATVMLKREKTGREILLDIDKSRIGYPQEICLCIPPDAVLLLR